MGVREKEAEWWVEGAPGGKRMLFYISDTFMGVYNMDGVAVLMFGYGVAVWSCGRGLCCCAWRA